MQKEATTETASLCYEFLPEQVFQEFKKLALWDH